MAVTLGECAISEKSIRGLIWSQRGNSAIFTDTSQLAETRSPQERIVQCINRIKQYLSTNSLYRHQQKNGDTKRICPLGNTGIIGIENVVENTWVFTDIRGGEISKLVLSETHSYADMWNESESRHVVDVKEVAEIVELWCSRLENDTQGTAFPKIKLSTEFLSIADRTKLFHNLMVYYFIASGAVDRLYAIRVGNDIPATEEEKLTIAVELTQRFVSRIHRLYNEEDWVSKTVPVGAEYEYSRPDNGKIIQKEFILHAEKLGMSEEEFIAAYQAFVKNPTPSTRKQLQIKELCRHLIPALPFPELEKLQQYGAFNTQNPHSIDDRRGFPVSRPEIDSLPTYNPFIQALEMLALRKLGIPMRDIAMHTTFSEAELTPEHTEAGYLPFLAFASGIFPMYISQLVARRYRNGQEIMEELARKPTRVDGETFKYPYLKGRRHLQKESGAGTEFLIQYNAHPDTAVELRSQPEHANPKERKSKKTLHFGGRSNPAHYVTDSLVFSSLFGSATALVQEKYGTKEQQRRTKKTWQSVVATWRERLAAMGLKNAIDEEGYGSTVIESDFDKTVTASDILLSQLVGETTLHPSRRLQIRGDVYRKMQEISENIFENEIPQILRMYLTYRQAA